MAHSLTAEEIHIWMLDLNNFTDSASLKFCNALLSPDEQQQAQRFYFDRHRRRFLVTRGAIRWVLSCYYENINPADWRFAKNSYGKPYTVNPALPESPEFNISHSGERIAIGVVGSTGIGIDIEAISRRREIIKIARRYFSSSEYGELCNLAPDEQLGRFFDLWTLKEAYIKACGKGLAIPLGQFGFSFPGNHRLNINFDPVLEDDSAHWKFWQYDDAESYRLALAIKATRPAARFKVVVRELASWSETINSNISLIRSCQGG